MPGDAGMAGGYGMAGLGANTRMPSSRDATPSSRIAEEAAATTPASTELDWDVRVRVAPVAPRRENPTSTPDRWRRPPSNMAVEGTIRRLFRQGDLRCQDPKVVLSDPVTRSRIEHALPLGVSLGDLDTSEPRITPPTREAVALAHAIQLLESDRPLSSAQRKALANLVGNTARGSLSEICSAHERVISALTQES